MKSKTAKTIVVILEILLLLYFAKDIVSFAFKRILTPIADFVLGNQIADL